MEKPLQGWHLSKQVPVAIIFTLLVQFAVGIWSAAMMRADIDANLKEIVRIDQEVRATTRSVSQQAVQLGRIEGAIEDMRGDIAQMVRLLEAKP